MVTRRLGVCWKASSFQESFKSEMSPRIQAQEARINRHLKMWSCGGSCRDVVAHCSAPDSGAEVPGLSPAYIYIFFFKLGFSRHVVTDCGFFFSTIARQPMHARMLFYVALILWKFYNILKLRYLSIHQIFLQCCNFYLEAKETHPCSLFLNQIF